jgi:DedD protein
MATEKLSEQEIQLRKRARRRLVGAIALVLLMVTVLPMVLDDREAQTPQTEIAVNIPSQEDNDFSSRIVPVEPGDEVVPPANQSPDAPVETPSPQPFPVPDNAPEPKVEPAKPLETAPRNDTAAPKAKTAEKPAVSEAFVVQIGVFSDAANVKQLQSKLAANGYKAYTEQLNTPGGTKLRLRVGPYGSRAEAEKARDKLKAAGTAGIVVAK